MIYQIAYKKTIKSSARQKLRNLDLTFCINMSSRSISNGLERAEESRIVIAAAVGIGFMVAILLMVPGGIFEDQVDNCAIAAGLPQQSNGIRIQITEIKGTQITKDQNGRLTGFMQVRQPINITALVVNTNNSTFSFTSLGQGLTIYDCVGTQVLSGDSISDMSRPVTLKPRDSLTIIQPWTLKINSQSESVLVDAPTGKYTIRVSFQGGGIQISDYAHIVISR